MKKAILYLCITLSTGAFCYAQGTPVGIGTTNPQAALDIVSTVHGILIPRMTALQVEAIANPDESELVYSLSANGTVVNKIGFWFYQSGVWVPISGTSAIAANIYTIDGTLTSHRIVDQNGKFLNFGSNLLYLSGSNPVVGINTNAPTNTLDVNGNMKIQALAAAKAVISDSNGVLMHNDVFFDYGDVKPSYSTTDHDGWYLLDGRSISALPANAQANAASTLGSITNLPNAAGRYSMGTTSTTGNTAGSNTVSLVQANLPHFTGLPLANRTNFTATASAAGAHTHTFPFQYTRINSPAVPGGNNIHVFWVAGTRTTTANYTETTAFTSHSHTFSVNSGGNNTPFSITPRTLNFNYFVYLGQ